MINKREILDIMIEKRSYSKHHRREYVETSWLERLGEGILDGIAKHDKKAFDLARAVLNHLEN